MEDHQVEERRLGPASLLCFFAASKGFRCLGPKEHVALADTIHLRRALTCLGMAVLSNMLDQHTLLMYLNDILHQITQCTCDCDMRLCPDQVRICSSHCNHYSEGSRR